MEQEKNIKILVCDDSEEIRELLSLLLGEEGYEVLLCRDGQEAVEAMDDTVSLAILDVVMPHKSGFDACREIREKSLAPILFLTAKTQDFDKTMGFAAGGDDYLSKPFSYSELISRVRALLRRYYVYQGGGPAAQTKTCYDLGGLVVDVKNRVAAAGGVPVGLTDIEFNLLALMAQSPRPGVFGKGAL